MVPRTSHAGTAACGRSVCLSDLLGRTEQPTATMAPDEMTFNYWTDVINALLGQPMVTKQKGGGLEDTARDGDQVATVGHPPPIPEELDNYDFNFEN